MAKAIPTSNTLPIGATRPAITSADTQDQWQLAWRRLRRNKPALLGGVLIILYAIVGLFASTLSPHNPVQANSGKDYRPAFWRATSPAGKPYDSAFPLGTDQLGRDVLSRVLYGTRSSFAAGVLPAVIVLLIGSLIGFASGYLGGLPDNILMRITDVFYAIPTELLLILVMITLGDSALGKWASGVPLFLMSVAVVSWSGLSRQVRGSALSLKDREFVEAARSLGASNGEVVMRHVLPNSIGILIVWMAFAIPRFMILEAVLGYIGLGLKPSITGKEFFVTSWGRAFLDAYSVIGNNPDYMITITVVVSLLVISFTFLGDGLRDALDPRMTRK